MRFAMIVFVGAITTVVQAQDSTRAPGPSGNVHILAASGATINGSLFGSKTSVTTSSSVGLGLTLGFGFNKWLTGFATIDDGGSQSTTTTGAGEFGGGGSQTLSQADAGLRFGYPLNKGKVVPYALLAYSMRMLQGSGSTPLFGSGTYSEWGGAVTYGLGIQLYASPSFAFDVSYLQSTGSYSRLQVPPEYRYSTGASSSTTSRFNAGGTWQIGPVGASESPLPPSTDSMLLGDAVRLHLASYEMVGTVIAMHPDSIVLQRVVRDTAQQEGVPRACISAVDREVPTKSVKTGLTNGAFLGAITGALAGVAVGSSQSSAPPSAGKFLFTYVLGGAVVGGGLGAVFGHEHNRWQPLHYEVTAWKSMADREAACAKWYRP
jgi:hypothetical protein